MNRLTDEIARRNEVTRDCWESYASHRQQVMRLLLEANQSPHDRLCILGAGNCNDLDLGALTKSYGEVHLVDVDGATLVAGAARQESADAAKVHLHDSVDLTGIGNTIGSWSPHSPPDPREVDACLERIAKTIPGDLPGPFDVVASTCLLSQLIEGVCLTLGARHPQFLDLVFGIRQQHLKLLVQLLVPGGRLVLITDVVSSDTYADLKSITDAELKATLIRLINDRNFFTGLNPFALQSLLTTDPWLSPRVQEPRLVGPWRWQMVSRWYLVCALLARRSAFHVAG